MLYWFSLSPFVGCTNLEKHGCLNVSEEHAPRTHNLLILAERAGLTLTDERRQQLVRITAYNLETRYPEDRASIRASR